MEEGSEREFSCTVFDGTVERCKGVIRIVERGCNKWMQLKLKPAQIGGLLIMCVWGKGDDGKRPEEEEVEELPDPWSACYR